MLCNWVKCLKIYNKKKNLKKNCIHKELGNIKVKSSSVRDRRPRKGYKLTTMTTGQFRCDQFRQIQGKIHKFIIVVSTSSH